MQVSPQAIASGGAGDRFSKGSPATEPTKMFASDASTLSGAHRGVAADNGRDAINLLRRLKVFWDRVASLSLAVCGASLCAFVLLLLSPSEKGIASVFYFDIRFYGSVLLISATLGTYGLLKGKRLEAEIQAVMRKSKNPRGH